MREEKAEHEKREREREEREREERDRRKRLGADDEEGGMGSCLAGPLSFSLMSYFSIDESDRVNGDLRSYRRSSVATTVDARRRKISEKDVVRRSFNLQMPLLPHNMRASNEGPTSRRKTSIRKELIATQAR